MHAARSSLMFAVLCLTLASTLAAQDYSSREKGRAEKLAAEDWAFASLPEDEKQQVIEKLAQMVHKARRKVIRVDIVTLDGKTLDELDAKQKAKYRGYKTAVREEERSERPGPEKTKLVSNHVDTKPFGRLFKDNEWDVMDGSEDAKAVQGQVDELLALLAKTGGTLVSMNVESSASALRNTGKAEKMTHEELSKARAQSAAKYVQAYLESKNVKLGLDQITLDYQGTNGDGTSGPASPYPCPKGVDPKLCPKGSGPAPTPDCVAPEDLDAFYDQFKYIRLTFDVVNEVVEREPGGFVTESAARLVLVDVDQKLKRRIPPPDFSGIRRWFERRAAHHRTRRGIRRGHSGKCPAF